MTKEEYDALSKEFREIFGYPFERFSHYSFTRNEMDILEDELDRNFIGHGCKNTAHWQKFIVDNWGQRGLDFFNKINYQFKKERGYKYD